jgi:hypothetical protein
VEFAWELGVASTLHVKYLPRNQGLRGSVPLLESKNAGLLENGLLEMAVLEN